MARKSDRRMSAVDSSYLRFSPGLPQACINVGLADNQFESSFYRFRFSSGAQDRLRPIQVALIYLKVFVS